VSEEFAAKSSGASFELDELFTPGQFVDARGTTRGRGLQRRHSADGASPVRSARTVRTNTSVTAARSVRT